MDNPLDNINAPLVSEERNSSLNELLSPELVEFPGFTQYHESNCFCCKKYTFGKGFFFLGHWEFKPLFPMLVSLIILTTYLFGLCLINPIFSTTAEIICDFLLTVLVIIYLFCYFMIIVEGPGYFPFYYSGIKNNKIKNVPEYIPRFSDSPYGVIVNTDQYLFAQVNDKPNRSILAKSARRIIIRPDHLCQWTSSWIGKKNMKMFIQFNFYGAIYCLVYLILCITSLVTLISKVEVNYVKFGWIIPFLLLSFSFLLWQLNNTIYSIKMMIDGRTSWEKWNKIDQNKFNKGRKKNIEDVFGSNPSICSYLCPTPPFKNISEEELVSDYNNYYK